LPAEQCGPYTEPCERPGSAKSGYNPQKTLSCFLLLRQYDVLVKFLYNMYYNIILLSDLSFQNGIIGLAEYIERREIAQWLSSGDDSLKDPRDPADERQFENAERSDEHPRQPSSLSGSSGGSTADDEDDELERWPRFLAFNKWVFTVGDRDCFPSVPYGHLYKKTNERLKLNPYTGRVFWEAHKEDPSLRLTRKEMKTLWNDPKFVEHCHEQVSFYSDFAREYDFPNARRGRYNFPRWR
jgi:hypothetical protein